MLRASVRQGKLLGCDQTHVNKNKCQQIRTQTLTNRSIITSLQAIVHRTGMSTSLLRTMATSKPGQRLPIHLMLDFDGTITNRDTMFAYGAIADARDVRLGRKPTGSETFKGFGTAWMDDYTTHEQNYSPKQQDRKDIREEIAWLTSLAKVETASAARVEGSGFFRHVTKDDIQRASDSLLRNERITFRNGWERLFSNFGPQQPGHSSDSTQPGLHISINSVNWSETFIRATMRNAAHRANLDPEVSTVIEGMTITANDLEGLENPDGASGRINSDGSSSTRTTDDKHRNLVSSYQKDMQNVYVGDSPTDLRCLLAAGLGICVRNDPMSSSSKELADLLTRTGYEVRHVSSCNSWSDQCIKDGPGGLLWANDFEEIANLLERLQEGHVSAA